MRSEPPRTGAQIGLEPDKTRKDRAKVFALLRVEWGLNTGDAADEKPSFVVGDEITDDLVAFEEVTEVLVARVRRPMKLLNVREYTRRERVGLKHVMLAAEARVRRAIDPLSRDPAALDDARAAVREAFAAYFQELVSHEESSRR